MTATTHIATSSPDDITVRGRSLTRDLIGKLTLTEMLCLTITGEVPDAHRIAAIDACLVALCEHGLTPSALATRLVYGSAPEAMQGAVAAGLLGVGSTFVGSTEGCAELLARIVAGADPRAIARENRRLPGFGHPLHKPVDPRTVALLALARAQGLYGAHCTALDQLSAAVDEVAGRSIVVNATAAVAALIADAGLPIAILRGIALISRCAGLVGHIREEQQSPAMRALWEGAEAAVPYKEER